MTILYLEEKEGLALELDGPALVIRREGESARLVPLQRLERIHLPATLDVNCRVLVACARAGVVICFANGRSGEPLAWMLGAPGDGGALAERLETLWRRTDAQTLFARWRKAQLLEVFRQLGQLLPHCEEADPQKVERELLRRAIRHAGERGARQSASWLEAEIRGELVKRLGARGLSPGQAVAWGARLVPILRWSAEAGRLWWLAHRHAGYRNRGQQPPPLERPEFTAFLESRAEALATAADELIERLELWLQDPGDDREESA